MWWILALALLLAFLFVAYSSGTLHKSKKKDHDSDGSDSESEHEDEEHGTDHHLSPKKHCKVAIVYNPCSPKYVDANMDTIVCYLQKCYPCIKFFRIEDGCGNLAQVLEELYLKKHVKLFAGFTGCDLLDQSLPFFQIREDAQALTCGCASVALSNIESFVPKAKRTISILVDKTLEFAAPKVFVLSNVTDAVTVGTAEKLQELGVTAQISLIDLNNVQEDLQQVLNQSTDPNDVLLLTFPDPEDIGYFVEQTVEQLAQSGRRVLGSYGMTLVHFQNLPHDIRVALNGRFFGLSRFFVGTPEINRLVCELDLSTNAEKLYYVLALLDSILVASRICDCSPCPRDISGLLGNLIGDSKHNLRYWWAMIYELQNGEWQRDVVISHMPLPIGEIQQ